MKCQCGKEAGRYGRCETCISMLGGSQSMRNTKGLHCYLCGPQLFYESTIGEGKTKHSVYRCPICSTAIDRVAIDMELRAKGRLKERVLKGDNGNHIQ